MKVVTSLRNKKIISREIYLIKSSLCHNLDFCHIAAPLLSSLSRAPTVCALYTQRQEIQLRYIRIYLFMVFHINDD